MANANGTPPACTNCSRTHDRKNPWNGEPEDLCPECEKARVDAIQRIWNNLPEQGGTPPGANANGNPPPATCQACGAPITGEIHQLHDDPTSAFCSYECQLEETDIQVYEMQLAPIPEPLPPRPLYRGPTPEVLHYDRFCECDEEFENQITVPRRHSLICFCPKCGCVTQD
jgi:hypothetical protein